MVDGHRDKTAILKEVGCFMFVDDRYRTIAELEHKIPFPVLYKRPWNQGRPYKETLTEIRDLRDIIPVVNMVTFNNPMDWPMGVVYPLKYGYGGDTLIEY
jgi:hypothetical protein